MASDEINKSSNLKVPPLRIVINNNNNNNNSNSTANATNGNNVNSINSFSGANTDATDLISVTTIATNQNTGRAPNSTTVNKPKTSTSNSSSTTSSETKSTNNTGPNSGAFHFQTHAKNKSDDFTVRSNSGKSNTGLNKSSNSRNEPSLKENEKNPPKSLTIGNSTKSISYQHSFNRTDQNQIANDNNHRELINSNTGASHSTENSSSAPSEPQPENNDSPNNKDQVASCLSTTQRITRSSQRAAQQNKSDIPTDHQMTSADEQNSNSENIDRGNEQGRKTKKRKGESPENDQDSSASTASSSNINQQPSLYQPPAQNSFQLYKNIRNQVDNRIRSLNCVHPKTPHGFKDYLLNRGVYLLDGNKLGNGSLATTSKNSELIRGSVPLLNNSSNVRNFQTTNAYLVPEQIKAPGSLVVSSPLYQLFIEQEKARHKMRMHHIKEREKLTLSAEQEILRVYNQAALAAANQLEPFSVCTLLKHQEIYNYIEPDEPTQASSQQATNSGEGSVKLDDTSAETDKCSNSEKNDKSSDVTLNKESSASTQSELKFTSNEPNQESKEATADVSMDVDQSSKLSACDESTESPSLPSIVNSSTTLNPANEMAQAPQDSTTESSTTPINNNKIKKELVEETKPNNLDCSVKNDSVSSKESAQTVNDNKSDAVVHTDVKKESVETSNVMDYKIVGDSKSDDDIVDKSSIVTASSVSPANNPGDACGSSKSISSKTASNDLTNNTQGTDMSAITSAEAGVIKSSDTNNQSTSDNSTEQVAMITDDDDLSDDARSIYNKKIFFGRLQDIDDKWERIKSEMLIRHKNEAESLYAVQKLEWEWKAKEIGACDVRTTPTIEQAFVPRVDVVSLDY